MTPHSALGLYQPTTAQQIAQRQLAHQHAQQQYLAAMQQAQVQAMAIQQYGIGGGGGGLCGSTYTSSSTGGTTSGTAWVNATSVFTTNTGLIGGTGGTGTIACAPNPIVGPSGIHYKVQDGYPCKLELPDRTVIDVKADGSFAILDKDAKVTYRANRVRDFNCYLNASDRLEEFIAFCGEQGVEQTEMLTLPLNLFIGWLVIEAAKADREEVPAIPLLEDLRKHVNGHSAVPEVPLPAAVVNPAGGTETERLRAEIAQLQAENRKLERERDMEALAGESIMECREYIEKHLHANAASLSGPNGQSISSPFFDDLIYALVDEVVKARSVSQAPVEPACSQATQDLLDTVREEAEARAEVLAQAA